MQLDATAGLIFCLASLLVFWISVLVPARYRSFVGQDSYGGALAIGAIVGLALGIFTLPVTINLQFGTQTLVVAAVIGGAVSGAIAGTIWALAESRRPEIGALFGAVGGATAAPFLYVCLFFGALALI